MVSGAVALVSVVVAHAHAAELQLPPAEARASVEVEQQPAPALDFGTGVASRTPSSSSSVVQRHRCESKSADGRWHAMGSAAKEVWCCSALTIATAGRHGGAAAGEAESRFGAECLRQQERQRQPPSAWLSALPWLRCAWCPRWLVLLRRTSERRSTRARFAKARATTQASATKGVAERISQTDEGVRSVVCWTRCGGRLRAAKAQHLTGRRPGEATPTERMTTDGKGEGDHVSKVITRTHSVILWSVLVCFRPGRVG